MLIQKFFHVRGNLEQTRERLSHLENFLQELEGVSHRATGEGKAQLELVTQHGFRAFLHIEQLPTESPTQTLLHSTGGDLEMAGLIEYLPVNDRLTEVQLTLDYTIKSRIHSAVDALTGSMDRFLSRQLRRLQSHLTADQDSAGSVLAYS